MCLLGLQEAHQRRVWGREVQLEGVRAAYAAVEAFPHTHATLLQDLAALIPLSSEGSQETAAKEAGERAEALPAAEADEWAVGGTVEMKLSSGEGSLSDDATNTSDGNGRGASAVCSPQLCADATGAGDISGSNRAHVASKVRRGDHKAIVTCVLQHVFGLCERVHVALGRTRHLHSCGSAHPVTCCRSIFCRLSDCDPLVTDRMSCRWHCLLHEQCPLTCTVVVRMPPS